MFGVNERVDQRFRIAVGCGCAPFFDDAVEQAIDVVTGVLCSGPKRERKRMWCLAQRGLPCVLHGGFNALADFISACTQIIAEQHTDRDTSDQFAMKLVEIHFALMLGTHRFVNEAVGLVDDHLDGCAIRPRAERARRAFERPVPASSGRMPGRAR